MAEMMGCPTNDKDKDAQQITDEPDSLLIAKAARHIHKEALT